MIDVILYSNSSEVNAVNKSITELRRVSGTLREQTSIMQPDILINGIDDIISSVNYAYIPQFKRYYFVKGMDVVRTGLCRLKMGVDVLYTYKDGILSNSAIIERNEKEYDLLLNDGLFRTQQKPRIITQNFPAGFNQWNFVLAISGN